MSVLCLSANLVMVLPELLPPSCVSDLKMTKTLAYRNQEA
jgi:hypothetical protein